MDDSEKLDEIHAMLTELMDVLRPLKTMAAGLRPMGRATMSPNAREAAKKLRELA